MKEDILENSASCWAGPRASIRSRWSRQSETGSFATFLYQLNWVGRESRPEVVGVSSLLARYVVNPTIAHILEANGAVALLRGTAT